LSEKSPKDEIEGQKIDRKQVRKNLSSDCEYDVLQALRNYKNDLSKIVEADKDKEYSHREF